MPPHHVVSPIPARARVRRWLVVPILAALAGLTFVGPALLAADDTTDLFDDRPVTRLEIRLSDASAERLRADPRRFVPATLVEQVVVGDGQEPEEVVHDEVAVRLKGSAGSFQVLDEKPGFTINMDAWHPGRRFHGLDKFHLNNTAQDPTLLHEWLGGELFRSAGIPAARVGHARVILDGRDLGLYALKEAIDRDFLERSFEDASGNLYDGGAGVDLDELTERDEGRSGPPGADVARLVEACRTDDAESRPAAIEERLDVEAFLDFVVMELLAGHWDGSTIGHNNYRLYFDPARDGRAVFIPHGMDQILGDPSAPILDMPPTIVGGAVMRVPAWRERFREKVRERVPLFAPDRLLPAIDAAAARLEPAISEGGEEALAAWRDAIADLRARVEARHAHLLEQAEAPEPEPVSFDGARQTRLGGWQPRDETGGGTIEEIVQDDGRVVFSIGCSDAGQTVASWRMALPLPPGRYLFQGLARGEGIDPLDDEQGSGAGLRISGGVRTDRVERDGEWTMLGYEFEVDEPRQVEFVAELRARAGRVLFNAESLVLVRLSEP